MLTVQKIHRQLRYCVRKPAAEVGQCDVLRTRAVRLTDRPNSWSKERSQGVQGMGGASFLRTPTVTENPSAELIGQQE